MELRETKVPKGWKVEFVHEGVSVSRAWVVDRQMRIGAAVLRVGGIGGVGTEEEYRRRGLARQVLERCVELMTREGYDASFLFGIQ
ncbi:MAG: GNAT family N-acetyltransferase, partial [Gemmatimonadota bacterium]